MSVYVCMCTQSQAAAQLTHTHTHTHVRVLNSAYNQPPSWGNNYNKLTRLSFVEHQQE